MSKECSSKHPEDLFPVKQNPRRPPHQNQPSTKISKTRSKQTKQFSLQHSSLRTRLQQRLPCSEPASSCSASPPLPRRAPQSRTEASSLPPTAAKRRSLSSCQPGGARSYQAEPSSDASLTRPARATPLALTTPSTGTGPRRQDPPQPTKGGTAARQEPASARRPPQPVTFQVPSPRMGILAPVFSCT